MTIVYSCQAIFINKILFNFRYAGEVGRFAKQFSHPNVGLFNHIRGISVVHGNLKDLSPKVNIHLQEFLQN